MSCIVSVMITYWR